MPLKPYFKELHAVTQQGDAREESYYPALAAMLTTLAANTGRSQIRVTTLPKATDAGNPDFRLWNGTDRIVGYVEAKRPTEERLDSIENSEQLPATAAPSPTSSSPTSSSSASTATANSSKRFKPPAPSS